MADHYDVVVVGGGNAALCAALAAAEKGARVALLERAPEEKRGGNSKFTGGGFRMVHHGAQDIKRVVPDLSEADIARTDFGEYTAEDYLDDLGRITQYYIDPDLAETLVQKQYRHRALADGPWGEVSAELRTAGLQPRRTIQVFRRRGDLRQRRRSGPGRVGIQGRCQARR